MPRTKYNVVSAMYDVRPVDDTGRVNVDKISNVESLLNLGRKLRIGKSGRPVLKSRFVAKKEKSPPKISKPTSEIVHEPDSAKDLERYLNEDVDFAVELAAIGAEVAENTNARPRHILPISLPTESRNQGSADSDRASLIGSGLISESNQNDLEEIGTIPNQEPEENYEDILKKINEKAAPPVEDTFVGEPKKTDVVDWWQEAQSARPRQSLGEAGEKLKAQNERIEPKSRKFKVPKFKIPRSKKWVAAVFAMALIGLSAEYSFSLKNEIFHSGNSAVGNLESAGEDIKKLDFSSASANFANAYADFTKAGDNLNFMGATMSSLLADLPGGSKLKSAKNLIEAGKLMADAGGAMSKAIEELAKTNLILNVGTSDVGVGGISKDLIQALTLSQKNIKEAGELLSKVNPDSLPEDKRADFEEFRSQLPGFEKLVADAVDYSKFLEDLTGTTGIKKYLIMFQNPAELRPTGGFPGSYGVVVFRDGKLQDFKVDDIYNLDGQLKELYVPPLQLQHITPNWAMRDVSWFLDFPVSAGKITEFYKKESGEDVDGVITFSPRIVSKMLEVIGPIRMDKYNVTLNSENFSRTIQDEIEYKADRAQPKNILVDFAPLLLEKIYTADSDMWMEMFNILVSSVDSKDILMYFRDLKLQDFSVTKGFSGQVNRTQNDYLMVALTNIKGSKTDSVVDSELKVDAIFEGKDIRHRVVLTRSHNGGGTEYGFWNKQSPSYVRVLVPENAQFLGISGNSRPNFQPLLNYSKTDFKRDEDLVRFEEKSYYDEESGVTIYEESGKTEYGFWMIVNPGETKSIELEYRVQDKVSGKDYEFYMQKQPGLEFKKFELNLISGTAEINQSSLELNKGDGRYTFNGKLDRDLPIRIIFK